MLGVDCSLQWRIDCWVGLDCQDDALVPLLVLTGVDNAGAESLVGAIKKSSSGFPSGTKAGLFLAIIHTCNKAGGVGIASLAIVFWVTPWTSMLLPYRPPKI